MKKLLILNVLLSLLLSPLSYAEEEKTELTDVEKKAQRYKKLDSIFLSMNPKYKTSGPIHRYGESQTKYSNNLVTLILQESHRAAKKYLDAGDHQAYYTFMILGLTVPFHEGLYLQFREVSNDDLPCRDMLNSGELKEKSNSVAKETYKNILLGAKNPLALPCEKLAEETKLKQIIAGGGDGSDIGVMQISTAFYQKEFFAKNLMYSTRQTLRFGLNWVLKRNNHRGFNDLYNNYHLEDKENNKDYSCLKNDDDTINYTNLIKATWAKYNAGSSKDACRFVNAEDKRDTLFASNLRRTLELEDHKNPMGHQGFNIILTPSKYIRNAITEIIQNFKNGTNNRVHINQIHQLNK